MIFFFKTCFRTLLDCISKTCIPDCEKMIKAKLLGYNSESQRQQTKLCFYETCLNLKCMLIHHVSKDTESFSELSTSRHRLLYIFVGCYVIFSQIKKSLEFYNAYSTRIPYFDIIDVIDYDN